MKKVLVILGVITLASSAAFARGGARNGGSCSDFGGGCYMMNDGFEQGWGAGSKGHKKGMGRMDDAQVTAFLKAKGVSDADIAKSLSIYKEKRALMERYWESSIRQTMKDRGMSDAEVTKLIQLQKDMWALQEKYNSK